jgi:hypothetical protein
MSNISKILTVIISIILLSSCQDNIERKGFQVSEISENEEGEKVVGLKIDSLKLETRPRNVLESKDPVHRLIPIYKVNYDKDGKPFTGSNRYHKSWYGDYPEGNNWNRNFMPGFEAVFGYNFLNVSHFNTITKASNDLFDSPVLIRTLYYPAFSNDSLNGNPIVRDYYMVSVYDDDTNKDGFINIKDLRRFYLFDIDGKMIKALVPKNYYVMNSEYDSDNDYMYIFAKIDSNKNGQMEQQEETHVFWIDLKNPLNNGLAYKK